jgi:hypothetical protein
MTLPDCDEERKGIPVATGCLDYFPAALAEIARLSKAGNDKHNPGQPLHHARGKSTDHADCLIRHFMDRGTVDPKSGFSHTVMMAWRALAMLQEELEARGAPLARGAKLPSPKPDWYTSPCPKGCAPGRCNATDNPCSLPPPSEWHSGTRR